VRFAKDGPSIPIEVLRSLEAGELVIFCGAGVSRQCGLPDFSGLVDSACARLSRPMEVDERELFEANAFDAALGLIERRIGKSHLRGAVRSVLELKPDADFSTHHALLRLAVSRQGRLRLVTTNFDRAFELSPFSGTRTFDYAPYLPMPAQSWNSIVHVHGGMGNQRDETDEFLVLTSADFGRAYITEGWASRFLSELFRRTQAVLFVGYSVADPAIRYIVDAFAADRANREYQVAKAFILDGVQAGESLQHERTWKSRGIEPIVYDPRDNHRLLHETLRNCAKRYAMGFFDRDSIILEYGSQTPLAGLEDEGTSQIKWALQDETGHAARKFARVSPPPRLAWLEHLEEVGLFDLPTSEARSVPVVGRVAASDQIGSLHPASQALCEWLCAHLGAVPLVQWVIKRGCHLHPSFAALVRRRLWDEKAERMPEGARLVWTFLSMEDPPIHTRSVGNKVLAHLDRLAQQPWDPLLRCALLSWLAPTVQLAEPNRWLTAEDVDLESVRAYADVELVPAAADETQELVSRLVNRPDASTIAREVLADLTEALHRGLSYLQFLERANGDFDRTSLYRPSIDEHPQNSELCKWTVYIRLLRWAWEQVAAADVDMAREEVSRWMRTEFPVFRSFVLWSVGKPGGLSPSESVGYLMRQPPSATWGLDTKHELLQYLARIAPQLSAVDADKLTNLILEGPPASQFRADIPAEQLTTVRSRLVYLRLRELRDGGLTLSAEAQAVMDQILKDHPEWDHAITEPEEFTAWLEGESAELVPDFEPQLGDYLTWTDAQIISDITEAPANSQVAARWRGLLAQDPQHAIRILDVLGSDGFFDNGVWALALEQLSKEKSRPECVRLFAAFGAHIGEDFISEHLQQLAFLVDTYCQGSKEVQDQWLWPLWDLLLGPAEEAVPDDRDDPVFAALNSPIGSLASALLNGLAKLHPETYGEIPLPMRDRLEGMLAGSRPAHRLARIMLARALAWLYRLKPDLVVPSFLSLFDWDTSGEARGVWSGYLTSPRMTPELWSVIRPLFLQLFPHSGDLGELENQLYRLFGHVLLREEFPLEPSEARRALTLGTAAGRAQVAWLWWRQADAAPDYGATLFHDRLKYLLTNVWPLELELRDETTSNRLADLALCCGTEFGDAVRTITPLLTKITTSHFLWSLGQKDHADKYPRATLALIDALAGEQIKPWELKDLNGLLTRIAKAEPELASQPKYKRLDALLRQVD